MLFMAPIITEIPIVLNYKLKMTILKDLLVEAFQGPRYSILNESTLSCVLLYAPQQLSDFTVFSEMGGIFPNIADRRLSHLHHHNCFKSVLLVLTQITVIGNNRKCLKINF